MSDLLQLRRLQESTLVKNAELGGTVQLWEWIGVIRRSPHGRTAVSDGRQGPGMGDSGVSLTEVLVALSLVTDLGLG